MFIMTRHLKSAFLYLLFVGAGLVLAYGATYARSWLTPEYTEANNGKYFAGKNTQIIVYGTSWCKYCKLTSEYFNKNNVSFEVLDIEKSELAKQQHAEIGEEGIPVVLIGNRRIVGYAPAAFDKARDALLVR